MSLAFTDAGECTSTLRMSQAVSCKEYGVPNRGHSVESCRRRLSNKDVRERLNKEGFLKWVT